MADRALRVKLNFMKTLAIIGASGFVGSALIESLVQKNQFKIVALSRSRKGEQRFENGAVVEWRTCDLFSLLEIEQALEGVDQAIYLVHSMLPSAALVQGSFSDLDLILADNFSRAAELLGLEQVVYLGGILPETSISTWSPHLKSRHEVEQVLASRQTPVTVLRAGLILGPGGSSSEMLQTLVERLPVMLCPKWTESLTSPVSLKRVVQTLIESVEKDQHKNKTYDLGEATPLNYQEMMQASAWVLNKRRLFFRIPLFSPGLSKLWVSLITGAPRNLVFPLVMSLKHTLIPSKDRLFPGLEMERTFSDMFMDAQKNRQTQIEPPRAYRNSPVQDKTVRSVQRLDLNDSSQVDAQDVAREYMRWLPKFLFPFLKVIVKGDSVRFCFIGLKNPALFLVLRPSRSTSDRQLFYIKGGWLAQKTNRGRLEFRVLQKPHVVLSAIHDFRPRLPWRIYKFTQALVHVWVMISFGRHLRKKD